MQFIQERFYEPGIKVFVYYNLHRHLFSVRALQGTFKGKVIAHAKEVFLTDCTFKVSEKGRQRVLSEKQKNVHAGVSGILSFTPPAEKTFQKEITYNPYCYSQFVVKENEEPIFVAKEVYLCDKKVFV